MSSPNEPGHSGPATPRVTETARPTAASVDHGRRPPVGSPNPASCPPGSAAPAVPSSPARRRSRRFSRSRRFGRNPARRGIPRRRPIPGRPIPDQPVRHRDRAPSAFQPAPVPVVPDDAELSRVKDYASELPDLSGPVPRPPQPRRAAVAERAESPQSSGGTVGGARTPSRGRVQVAGRAKAARCAPACRSGASIRGVR